MAKLKEQLWHPDRDTYVILNGAVIGYELINRLWDEHQNEEFFYLFQGDMEPKLAQFSPFLVKLVPNTPLTDWVLSGWGKAWALFLQVERDVKLNKLVRSLKRLTSVYHQNKGMLRCLYYNPEVWNSELSHFSPDHIQAFFEHTSVFISEDHAGQSLRFTSLNNQQLSISKIQISGA